MSCHRGERGEMCLSWDNFLLILQMKNFAMQIKYVESWNINEKLWKQMKSFETHLKSSEMQLKYNTSTAVQSWATGVYTFHTTNQNHFISIKYAIIKATITCFAQIKLAQHLGYNCSHQMLCSSQLASLSLHKCSEIRHFLSQLSLRFHSVQTWCKAAFKLLTKGSLRPKFFSLKIPKNSPRVPQKYTKNAAGKNKFEWTSQLPFWIIYI